MIIGIVLLSVVLFLSLGSFVGAFSYRLPKNIKVSKGRSFCPYCKEEINWYDNIPLLSYFLLGGKCRNCCKKISKREPFIEFFTAVVLSIVSYRLVTCFGLFYLPFDTSVVCNLSLKYGLVMIIFWLVVIVLLNTILVIDLENFIIPDSLVFFLYLVISLFLIMNPTQAIYLHLFSGLIASSFLLLLNLITKGKGMGLGDVKLALVIGTILSFKLMVVWMLFSFVLGAIVGIFLLLTGKAKIGNPIPFGPFLIIGFYALIIITDISFLWGLM